MAQDAAVQIEVTFDRTLMFGPRSAAIVVMSRELEHFLDGGRTVENSPDAVLT
jgi:hypothetical protein